MFYSAQSTKTLQQFNMMTKYMVQNVISTYNTCCVSVATGTRNWSMKFFTWVLSLLHTPLTTVKYTAPPTTPSFVSFLKHLIKGIRYIYYFFYDNSDKGDSFCDSLFTFQAPAH